MPIPLISTIVPQNSGAFPTHDAQYGKGGFQSVADNTARDAIPVLNRTQGMLVYSIGAAATYRLGADLTTWTVVPEGGGGGTPASIVWKPGVVSSAASVATPAEVRALVAAALAAGVAEVIVGCDDSQGACNWDGVDLPGGWRTIVQPATLGFVTLNIPDGAHFENVRWRGGASGLLVLTNASVDANAPLTFTPDPNSIGARAALDADNVYFYNLGTAPVCVVDAAIVSSFAASNRGIVAFDSSGAPFGAPFFRCVGPLNISISLSDGAFLAGVSVEATNPGAVLTIFNDAESFVDIAAAFAGSFAGTIRMNPLAQAINIPANNNSGLGTNVQAQLNALAARSIRSLSTGNVPYTAWAGAFGGQFIGSDVFAYGGGNAFPPTARIFGAEITYTPFTAPGLVSAMVTMELADDVQGSGTIMGPVDVMTSIGPEASTTPGTNPAPSRAAGDVNGVQLTLTLVGATIDQLTAGSINGVLFVAEVP